MVSIPELERFRILQNENCVCTNESCVSAIVPRERTALDDQGELSESGPIARQNFTELADVEEKEAVMIDIVLEDLEVL